MRRLKRTGLLLAATLCSVPAWADTDALRVLGVAGTVEIQKGAHGRWTPVAKATKPSAGDRVRTGEKSSADFVFDRAYDGMARLGEKTSVRIASLAPARWEVEHGKIWVLWEYESSGVAPFRLDAAGLAELDIDGGAGVDVTTPKVLIRSYGRVAMAGQQGALEEGFQAVVEGREAGEGKRMGYGEYQDWRAWMIEAYRYKDNALRPS